MKGQPIVIGLAIASAMLGFACEKPASAPAAKPPAAATVSGAKVPESELATVTLSEDAEKRLGIAVAAAKATGSSEVRRFSGEVTLPQGRSIHVTSPVSGTLKASDAAVPAVGGLVRKGQVLFRLTPLLPTPVPRDLRASIEADLEQARARLETARQRKARADRLVRDEVGTVRAQEDAQHELDLAAAAVRAAEIRLNESRGLQPLMGDTDIDIMAPQQGVFRQVTATAGQAIGAGTPLVEIADFGQMWIRVPIYASDAASLVLNAPISVYPFGGSGSPRYASPVTALPTADTASSTVDYYYAATNDDLRLKPGERVTVAIGARSTRNWITVPWSAVVYDIRGGAWVYESVGNRKYSRRRIDLDHSGSGLAFIASGLATGTSVVVAGAAELWGTEFGTGK